jgi:hypothetical protein
LVGTTNWRLFSQNNLQVHTSKNKTKQKLLQYSVSENIVVECKQKMTKK